jgi:probable rRNA maturation factor
MPRRSNDCYSGTEGGGCLAAIATTLRFDDTSGVLLPAPTRMKAVRSRSARVHVAVKVRDGAYAAAVLRAAGRGWVARGEELSIALVTDREMRSLNFRWRKQDRPTDVLSFPLAEPGILGDVVVSIDTARRQAKDGGWPLAAELRRLLAHGVLHCRGYDHESPADARRMAAAERRLLGRSGMVGASLSGAE